MAPMPMDRARLEAREASEGEGKRTLSTNSEQKANWNLAVRFGRSTIFLSRKSRASFRAAGKVRSGSIASEE